MSVRVPDGAGAPIAPVAEARTVAGDRAARRYLLLRDFVGQKMGVLGLLIIVVMILFSFVGPLVYKTNQVQTNVLEITLAPGGGHPLGTDAVGYDVLGRLMFAGRSSLEVGVAAAVIAAFIGTFTGALAGFTGGWLDAVLMRLVDALVAIPALLLVLLIATLVTPSTGTVILVLGMLSWLTTARLVRGEVLVIRRLDYVRAAESFGQRRWRILYEHIVRNVVGTVVVQATFEVANAILLLAALSFLGLGPPPPAANWGGMLTDGLNYIADGYWWLIYPAGVCIVLTVVAFNLLGDALRDVVEVRLRSR
ncbi:MAG TPA: ABC transporter permease [Solirubrobacteraceae bacterium]|jgi:peptide/nickel transport system permease protein